MSGFTAGAVGMGVALESLASLSSHRAIERAVRHLAPPLTSSLHKGSLGKIGIVGGSAEYTGAPYYAAMTALRIGADLSHVFCTPEAGTAIKSYSPDIVVHPVLRSRDNVAAILDWLPRMSCLVIGPGLGRSRPVLEAACVIIEQASRLKLPTVIDGDALWLLSDADFCDGLGLVSGSRWDGTPVVLTPNAMEFARLQRAVDARRGLAFSDLSETLLQRIQRTSGQTNALVERLECRGKEIADSWWKRDAVLMRGGGDETAASLSASGKEGEEEQCVFQFSRLIAHLISAEAPNL